MWLNSLYYSTFNQQVILWDMRSNRRIPVQRSPLSSQAHTHPVYCVSVVGTENAHNLITISSDGKLCSWSLDMLSQPQVCCWSSHNPILVAPPL